MRKYIFTEKSHTFKRINKKTARTAYKNGLTVIICPCNLRPFTLGTVEQYDYSYMQQ